MKNRQKYADRIDLQTDPQIVEVEWVDSIACEGWIMHEDGDKWIADSIGTILSVGYLMRNDDQVVLASALSCSQRHTLFSIPRGCVVAIRPLGKPKRAKR